LRDRRRISDHEQERGASQPGRESLYGRNALVMIRLGNNQLQRGLFYRFVEKRGKENNEKQQNFQSNANSHIFWQRA